jgi:hypothetical protein
MFKIIKVSLFIEIDTQGATLAVDFEKKVNLVILGGKSD